jgi:hypothetical protein
MLGGMRDHRLPLEPLTAAICGQCGMPLTQCHRLPQCFIVPVRFWRPDLDRHETLDEAKARKLAQTAKGAQHGPADELDALRAIVCALEPLGEAARARVLLYVALQTSPHALPFDALVDLLRAGQQPA